MCWQDNYLAKASDAVVGRLGASVGLNPVVATFLSPLIPDTLHAHDFHREPPVPAYLQSFTTARNAQNPLPSPFHMDLESFGHALQNNLPTTDRSEVQRLQRAAEVEMWLRE